MTIALYAALLVLGVALLAITAVRVLVGGGADSSSRAALAGTASKSRAQQILEERYAAGELSTDEFQRRSRVLREGDR